MQLPRINPVGVRETAEDFEESPRTWSPRMKAFAFFMLSVFAVVTVITTAASLGAYCLTTDTSDVRALVPAGLVTPPRE